MKKSTNKGGNPAVEELVIRITVSKELNKLKGKMPQKQVYKNRSWDFDLPNTNELT